MDNLTHPRVIKGVMKKFGVNFTKSLGQNFLKDDFVIDDIITQAEITKEDVVLEIGPGIGVLTNELAKAAKKVVSVEIDTSLIELLGFTLKEHDNVKIINQDILKLDIKNVIKEEFNGQAPKVIANLPYYITTPIIMRFLEENIDVTDIIVMVQKEVAERMQAVPSTKKYGKLSIGVQYYSEPEILFHVSKNSFVPQPRVDSAIIRLRIRQEPCVELKDSDLFFKTVKAAFAKRRKTLLNCLSTGNLGIEKTQMKELLESIKIEPRRRGETLTIEEFAKLSNTIFEWQKK